MCEFDILRHLMEFLDRNWNDILTGSDPFENHFKLTKEKDDKVSLSSFSAATAILSYLD